MKYSFQLEIPPSSENASQILHQLHDHNRNLWPGYTYAEPYGLFIKDKTRVLGGAVGHVWIGSLRIDRLFVREDIRCQGYGKELLLRIEALAHERNISLIMVETLSFQNTLPFYMKHGYTVAFQDNDLAEETVMYHLRKKLK